MGSGMQQSRIRLKLCGLTRAEDIAPMVNSGADAIGLVFYPPSRRYLTAEQARALWQQIPALVTTVGLFVNPEPQAVQQVLAQAPVDLLQFHGEEMPDFCRSFKRPYIKAFRVGAPGLDSAAGLLDFCRRYADARAWLFDSYTPEYGGSGVSFDLSILAEMQTRLGPADAPIILAGGLDLTNLQEKIQAIRPYAVDVSSGVEQAPGIKCAQKIKQLSAALAAL